MKTEDGMNIPVPTQNKILLKKVKKFLLVLGQKILFLLNLGKNHLNAWDYKSKVNLSEPLGTETLIFTNFGRNRNSKSNVYS